MLWGYALSFCVLVPTSITVRPWEWLRLCTVVYNKYSGDDDSANNRVHLKPFDNIILSYTYDVIQRRRQVYKYDSLTCGQTTGLITGYQTFPIKTICTNSNNSSILYKQKFKASDFLSDTVWDSKKCF